MRLKPWFSATWVAKTGACISFCRQVVLDRAKIDRNGARPVASHLTKHGHGKVPGGLLWK